MELQPYFFDMLDLNLGGKSLKKMHKSKMMSPFNFELDLSEFIEVNKSEVYSIFEKCDRPAIGDIYKKKLQRDECFRFFARNKVTVDLAQVVATFYELIAIKGISKKLNDLYDIYEKDAKKRKVEKQTDIYIDYNDLMDSDFDEDKPQQDD